MGAEITHQLFNQLPPGTIIGDANRGWTFTTFADYMGITYPLIVPYNNIGGYISHLGFIEGFLLIRETLNQAGTPDGQVDFCLANRDQSIAAQFVFTTNSPMNDPSTFGWLELYGQSSFYVYTNVYIPYSSLMIGDSFDANSIFLAGYDPNMGTGSLIVYDGTDLGGGNWPVGSANAVSYGLNGFQKGQIDVNGTFTPSVTGLSVTITTAKLTGGGSQGTMTFTNGVLTAQTQAT